MKEFPFLGEDKRLDADERAKLPGAFIETPLGVVHYELAGPEEAPLVVLVHGFSVPYFIWDPTYEALVAAGLRVLRYDLFGRGFSDRPLVTYDEDLFDRQLIDLLDALGVSQAVHLLGLSMGGMIVANFTDRHPERVLKLGFVDPAGFELNFPLTLRLVTLPGIGEVLFSLFGDSTLLKGMASDFFSPELVNAFLESYKPQMKYKGFKRAILSTMRAGILGDKLAVYQRVGAQDRDVLLVWGREDETVPFEHSAKLVKAIPQARFYPIDGAGHVPHYEKAAEVNPLIVAFYQD
ncbi:MAG: alpha/beta fold hydrolase [Anaerolineales bacterium]|nr:alpha/beta fold hydrolase [Anaerolineales bacterium]